MQSHHSFGVLVAAALLVVPPAASARDVRVAEGIDVTVAVHAAAGDRLILWLPSGIEGAEPDEVQAEKIRTLGIEVWRADLFGARFLPALESSLEQVPEKDIGALIDAARQHGKRVTLLASASAGLLALRGAQAWQRAHPGVTALDGVILIHPNLYLGPPEAGREPEFHPQVTNTNLSVHIVQPQKSPWHFRLDSLQSALERGGARVTLQLLPEVRDRYYFRADATDAENVEAARFPEVINRAIDNLRGTPFVRSPRGASVANTVATQTRQRGLQPYRGSPHPPALQLADLAGGFHDLKQLRKRVVLVNFWASWCPPCVHEMPSMQRLKEKLAGRPFTILAVNMAESSKDVRAFLNKSAVDFPVLMDRDGAVLKRWKVFVFPTSFVVDTDGHIRFGVVGEVEWDSPEVMAKLIDLFPASP